MLTPAESLTCADLRYPQGQQTAVCRVSAVTSVDHLLAAGHRSGDISVFLVPRLARGDVPDYVRITENNIKKVPAVAAPGCGGGPTPEALGLGLGGSRVTSVW